MLTAVVESEIGSESDLNRGWSGLRAAKLS